TALVGGADYTVRSSVLSGAGAGGTNFAYFGYSAGTAHIANSQVTGTINLGGTSTIKCFGAYSVALNPLSSSCT
ncbi:MAG: hypothetical protein H7123_04180, partial [Thermoleophilia bacterium]|nr:hypothetical protein [Thermoleophilia bacterium]